MKPFDRVEILRDVPGTAIKRGFKGIIIDFAEGDEATGATVEMDSTHGLEGLEAIPDLDLSYIKVIEAAGKETYPRAYEQQPTSGQASQAAV